MFALSSSRVSKHMNIYIAYTLVDITDNGNLNLKFPFTAKSGDLIHDKETLAIARQQQSNLNTLIQTIQCRANITWQDKPVRDNTVTANTRFGTQYAGKQNVWAFVFESEQSDVFALGNDPVGALEQDLDSIPILSFCKETATFPVNAFITQNDKTRNLYFQRATEDDLENYPHI